MFAEAFSFNGCFLLFFPSRPRLFFFLFFFCFSSISTFKLCANATSERDSTWHVLTRGLMSRRRIPTVRAKHAVPVTRRRQFIKCQQLRHLESRWSLKVGVFAQNHAKEGRVAGEGGLFSKQRHWQVRFPGPPESIINALAVSWMLPSRTFAHQDELLNSERRITSKPKGP